MIADKLTVHKQKVIDKAGNDKEVVNILTSDYIRNASDVHHNNDVRHSGSGCSLV